MPFQGNPSRLLLETEPAGVVSEEPKPPTPTPTPTPPEPSKPTATPTPTPTPPELATAAAARFMRTMPLAALAGDLARRWPAASVTLSAAEAQLLTPADMAMRAAAVVFAEALHRLRVPSATARRATAPRLDAAATQALQLLAGGGVDAMGPHDAAARILRPVLQAAAEQGWTPAEGLTPALATAIGAAAAQTDTVGPSPRPTERRGQHPSEGAAPVIGEGRV